MAKVWGFDQEAPLYVTQPSRPPAMQNEAVGHESALIDWGPRVVVRASPFDHEVPLNVFR